MTKVEFYKDINGFIYGLEIKGHSGYSVKGYDIVCASISSITCIIQLFLNHHKLNHTSEIEDGYFKVTSSKRYELETIQVIFRICKEFLEGISEQYPDNVQVREVFI